MSVLIKNGHIFTAVDSYVADILVDDGKIRTIGIDLSADAEKTIDATGKYVIPGGIDPHTHLDFPFGGTVSSDDFSTGIIAAAAGGDHQHCGLCRAATGPVFDRSSGDMAPEGRRLGHGRLRFPHDHPGPAGSPPVRGGRDGQTGRHQLQDVHGLPRRSDVGRRHDLQSHGPGGGQRGVDLPARRTRTHDRCPGAGSPGPGTYRTQVSRQHPPAGRYAWPRSPARRSTLST